jgi:4-hydroxy-2-oxoheptanedioate aldolase
MFESRCRKAWASGDSVDSLLINFGDPRVTELASSLGWDCLWIDLEHHPRTVRELEDLCRAARAGALGNPDGPPDIMARPGRWEFMQIGRLLEAGAAGILYPRCESADEAREAVRWTKFCPLGERGFDGSNADNLYGGYPAGDYVPQSNRRNWLAVQIESPAALQHVEAIAHVPGVDMVFFGPGDFSCLSGVPGQLLDPKVVDAMRRTANACRDAGIIFGTLTLTPEQRQVAAEAGCRFFGIGSEQCLLVKALKQLQLDLATERQAPVGALA